MKYYIDKICKTGSRIITDEYVSYKFLHQEKDWSDKYDHKWVNHSVNYVDPDDPEIHTNNIKS